MTDSSTVQKPKGSRAASVATGLTGFYLLLVGGVLYGHGRSLTDLAALEPNELGDFLAGASAPLAFLWFVTAVIMQRRELELTREEFAMTREITSQQATEARRQAESIAEQVAILKEQQEAASRSRGDQIYSQRYRRLEEEVSSGGAIFVANLRMTGRLEEHTFGEGPYPRHLKGLRDFLKMLVLAASGGRLETLIPEPTMLSLLEFADEAKHAALSGSSVSQDHCRQNYIDEIVHLHREFQNIPHLQRVTKPLTQLGGTVF